MKHSDVTRYLRELLALCNHMQCLLWKKNNGKPRTVHTVCLCLGWTTFCSVLQIYQKKQCQTPLDLEITFRLYIKQHKRWNKSQNTYRHKLEVSADSPPPFSRRQRKVQWIDSALKHRHIGTHRPAAQTHRNTGNSTDTSEHPDQHRHIGTLRPAVQTHQNIQNSTDASEHTDHRQELCASRVELLLLLHDLLCCCHLTAGLTSRSRGTFISHTSSGRR